MSLYDIFILIGALLFAALIIVIRIVVKKGVYKASDAIRNKYYENKELKNPPVQENLADRFNNQ